MYATHSTLGNVHFPEESSSSNSSCSIWNSCIFAALRNTMARSKRDRRLAALKGVEARRRNEAEKLAMARNDKTPSWSPTPPPKDSPKTKSPLSPRAGSGVTKTPPKKRSSSSTKSPVRTPPPSTSSSQSSPSKKTPLPSSSSSPGSASTSGLCKRRGKAVETGKVINPEYVNDNRPLKRFPDVETPKSHGLWNEGNFCYRNATIQALIHVPAVYRYLGIVHQDCPLLPRNCVVCALQSLAQTYWNDTAKGKTKKSLLKTSNRVLNDACKSNLPDPESFVQLLPEFEEDEMSDAAEFLQYLLWQIRQTAAPAQDSLQFRDMFVVERESGWECEDCSEQTIAPEGGSNMAGGVGGLDVQIQQPRTGGTLVEYLRYQFREKLSIYCDSAICSRKHNKKVRLAANGPIRENVTRLVKTPNVLIIRLNRFRYVMEDTEFGLANEEGSPVAEKLDTAVFFDEYLNLAEFVKDLGEDDELLYRLDAVIAHNGTKRGGHYITAAREQNGTEFININDKAVQKTRNNMGTFMELQYPEVFSRGMSSVPTEFNPYILIYSKL